MQLLCSNIKHTFDLTSIQSDLETYFCTLTINHFISYSHSHLYLFKSPALSFTVASIEPIIVILEVNNLHLERVQFISVAPDHSSRLCQPSFTFGLKRAAAAQVPPS